MSLVIKISQLPTLKRMLDQREHVLHATERSEPKREDHVNLTFLKMAKEDWEIRKQKVKDEIDALTFAVSCIERMIADAELKEHPLAKRAQPVQSITGFLLAAEFGYRCAEKGMNLQAALDLYRQVHEGTVKPEDAFKRVTRDQAIRARRLSDSEGGI